MFFFMMFSIAIDSQLGLVETVISGLMDEFKVFRNRRALLVAVYCILQFLLGIPMITQGGMYILQIIDWYHGLFTLMIVAIIECIVVGWVYGTDRFLGNIEHMIGYRPCQWWGVLWKFITPALLLSVLVFNMIQLRPVSYGTYEYPTWATGIGWMIGLSSVAAIVGYLIVALVLAKGSLIQRLTHTLTASTEWKPAISKSSDFYINDPEDDNDGEEKL